MDLYPKGGVPIAYFTNMSKKPMKFSKKWPEKHIEYNKFREPLKCSVIVIFTTRMRKSHCEIRI